LDTCAQSKLVGKVFARPVTPTTDCEAAMADQFAAIVGDDQIGAEAIRVVERTTPDFLRRIIFFDVIALEMFVRVVGSVFMDGNADEKSKIRKKALQRCLGQQFGGDEIGFISTTLGGAGGHLDAAWVARLGLAHDVSASIASRNMMAFCNAPHPARLAIVSSIVDVAQLLRDRQPFDLDEAGACAQLLFEAEAVIGLKILESIFRPQKQD
jgi:hypothetical protein